MFMGLVLSLRPLFRLASEERIAVDLELPRFLLARSLAKCVVAWADLDIYESDLVKHRSPAFARKATGDSGSP
jgi:hypothetical protein